MANRTTPSHALAKLSAQHDGLRDMIARCEELAGCLDNGDLEPAQLLGEVVALRRAFDAHNQFEEQLLRPMLLDVDWSGPVRVSRMIEDHVSEHRSMRRDLDATTTSELRAVLANLRAHLAFEERYFLTKKVLRDDLVR
jgi:iron-sulfur cluster repair protein YtfE (RIC family)